MLQRNFLPKNPTICIVGLGYVGLPLAVEFGKSYQTIGFEINAGRVKELQKGIDSTLEVEAELLQKAKKLTYTYDVDDIRAADVIVILSPTA